MNTEMSEQDREFRIGFSDRLDAAKSKQEKKALWAEFNARFPEQARKANMRRDSFRASTINERRDADEKIRKLKLLDLLECPYCRSSFHPSKMHVDHIMPITNGGKHTPENVTLCCPPCNTIKGCRIIGINFFPLEERRTFGPATGALTFAGWDDEQTQDVIASTKAALLAKHSRVVRHLRQGFTIRHTAQLTENSVGTVEMVKKLISP